MLVTWLSEQCQSGITDMTVTVISYQILARLRNGADVHWLPVNGVDEASLGHSDGTDDVDPASDRERKGYVIIAVVKYF